MNGPVNSVVRKTIVMDKIIFVVIYLLVAVGVDATLQEIEGYDKPFHTSLYWPTLLGVILVEHSHESINYVDTLKVINE